MKFPRVLLWLILACIHYVLSLSAAILSEIADSFDVVMCWLENGQ